MKKLAKTLLTLAVTAGLALSVSAFSACGDGREVLIDGDYSAQATETQLTTLREYASKTSDDLLGDSSASGWSYNARYNASGDVVAGIEMSAEGQTVGMDMGMNVNYDHVISLANSETGPSVRGSGNMNYNMTVDMAIPGMEAQDVSISLDGASYNDENYFYLDGAFSMSGGGTDYSQANKIKLDYSSVFGDIFQTGGSDAFVDITPALEALETVGAAVYVDESSSFKVKISLSAQGWAELYGEAIEEISGALGSDLGLEVIADNTDFGHCDIYLDFDKESGVLLGYGTSVDASFGYSATANGASVSVTYDMDIDSWFLSTDSAAGELPSDLDDYEYVGM